MNIQSQIDAPENHTSGVGAMRRAGSIKYASIITIGLSSFLSSPATGSTYRTHVPLERTASGPVRPSASEPVETTAAAVLEIRRRSGLTWEELGDLFDVSRRSVHHWSSGKAVSAANEQAIRQILAAIRRLDQGASGKTRAFLLTPDTKGVTALDLLKGGRLQEAYSRTKSAPIVERKRLALSKSAQDSRRPPTPGELLDGVQSRLDTPTRVQLARVVRSPKVAG